MSPEEDRLLSILPIRYSNVLCPELQLHQFPLLGRPLQVPPSAVASGKHIQARYKPNVRRLEVHVPVDSRPEVWNTEKSKQLGSARETDDKEKNQDSVYKGKHRDDALRLSEVRLRSERVAQQSAYLLGVLRDGILHLHPVSEIYQLRPTLTYMDVLSRKGRRPKGSSGSDSDSDEGPPADPDDPAPTPSFTKKEKVVKSGESKEVQLSMRKLAEDKSTPFGGGMTVVRREILMSMRGEDNEKWEAFGYYDGQSVESGEAFRSMLSHSNEVLECRSDITQMLKDIHGL